MPSKNKAVIRASDLRYRAKHPLKIEDRRLIRLYNLSLQKYKVMLQNQHFRCAICKTHKDFVYRKKLDVDHNHLSGRIRGLLCSSCNNILGRCKDNIITLQMAINYLKRDK